MHASPSLVLVLVLALALALVACGAPMPAAPCLQVPGVTVEALRGGGWDANGTSLRGGGWDANGTSLDALDAVTLVDARTGAPAGVHAGRLVDAHGAALDDATLEALGADGRHTALAAHLARIDASVPLYDLSVDGVPVCEGLAMLAQGAWDASGARVAVAPDVVTVACEHGVIAKCALWGYAPWLVGDAAHAACTRMARADYCGDGTPWTRDGTWIDITDPAEIQVLAGGADMTFEAGWSAEGAVCVRATRYEVRAANGATLVPPCWASLPRCDDADAAFVEGALMANYTLHAPIAACP